MLSPLSSKNLTVIVMSSLLLMMSLAHALPVSDKPECVSTEENCQDTNKTQKSTVDTIAAASKDDKLPRDVFELLGARLVNVDVVKLVDRKTAAMLNTAVYPMRKGKSLIESYVEKAYSRSSGPGKKPWSGDSFSADYKIGSAKGRSWANVATYTPDRDPHTTKYNKSKAEQEDEIDESWIAKSASAAEYAAVFILIIIFWFWFRQSRSY